ncbi:MAG: hypothetical protein ACRET5_17325 [Steroidobacteraceae bacterium]
MSTEVTCRCRPNIDPPAACTAFTIQAGGGTCHPAPWLYLGR